MNHYIENYQGIRIIETENTDLFLQKCFIFSFKNEDSFLQINNFDVLNDDILVINNLTKISDIYNITSKNILYKMINKSENFNYEKLINNENILNFQNEINSIFNNSVIEYNFDVIKFLKYCFQINSKLFLDKLALQTFLEKFENKTKLTIILNNIEWISIEDLEPFITKFNFIILTNNPIKFLTKWDYWELLSFYESEHFVNIYSKNQIFNWLENLEHKKIDTNIINCDIFLDKLLFFKLKNDFFV